MTAHVLISGKVQGIGFRYFVKSKAKRFGLLGWVTNTQDGKVEAKFVGEKEKIEEIIKLCRKGPFLAQVDFVDVKWRRKDEEFEIFEIIS